MLQFVREISIAIKIQKALSHRRGFHFHLAAGFAGEVEPLSGMAVNLVLVDQWLTALKTHLESQTFESESESLNGVFARIHSQAAEFLKTRAGKLASLSFREERGFGFESYLVPLSFSKDLEFFSTHYLELVAPNSEAKLLKIQPYWQWKKNCPADFPYETFKLLKPLMSLEAEDLLDQLSFLKGHQLPSGSILSRIEVHDTVKKVTLEI